MILLDLDGVLVDFHKGFQAHNKIEDPYLDPVNFGKYNLHPEPEHWISDSLFWRDLEWMPDGRKILVMCEEIGDTYIVTNPSECPEAAKGKLLWIKRHIPRFMNKVLIGAPKFICDGILVDDCDENIDLHRSVGKKAVLVPRPWNRKHHLNTLHHLEKELCPRRSSMS